MVELEGRKVSLQNPRPTEERLAEKGRPNDFRF
jgi:hypothetical protein